MDRRWATGIAGKKSMVSRVWFWHKPACAAPSLEGWKESRRCKAFILLLSYILLKTTWFGEDSADTGGLTGAQWVQLRTYYKSLCNKSTWKKRSHIPTYFKFQIKTWIFEIIIPNSSAQFLLYFYLLQLKKEAEYWQKMANHYSED